MTPRKAKNRDFNETFYKIEVRLNYSCDNTRFSRQRNSEKLVKNLQYIFFLESSD